MHVHRVVPGTGQVGTVAYFCRSARKKGCSGSRVWLGTLSMATVEIVMRIYPASICAFVRLMPHPTRQVQHVASSDGGQRAGAAASHQRPRYHVRRPGADARVVAGKQGAVVAQYVSLLPW